MMDQILKERAAKLKQDLRLERIEGGELFLRRLADELNNKHAQAAYTKLDYVHYKDLIGSKIYGLDIYLSESLGSDEFVIITT